MAKVCAAFLLLRRTPPLLADRYNQFFNTQTGASKHITQWVANSLDVGKGKGPTLLLEQVQCGGDGGGEGEDEDPHAGGGDAGGGAEDRTGLRMQTSPLPCPHLPTSRQPPAGPPHHPPPLLTTEGENLGGPYG